MTDEELIKELGWELGDFADRPDLVRAVEKKLRHLETVLKNCDRTIDVLEAENQALKDEVARFKDEAKGRRTRL